MIKTARIKRKSCRGKTEKHELIVHQPQRVDTNNKTIKDIGCEKYRTYFLDTDGIHGVLEKIW